MDPIKVDRETKGVSGEEPPQDPQNESEKQTGHMETSCDVKLDEEGICKPEETTDESHLEKRSSSGSEKQGVQNTPDDSKKEDSAS